MRKSERRESILKMASELFSSKGYLETRMADIAEACGIAKGTMYEYFSSKDALAAEWCRESMKEYKSHIECDVMIYTTPSEKLKALIRLDIRYFRRFTGYFFILFQLDQLFYSEKSDFLTEIAFFINYHYRLISSIIEEGQNCGEFRRVDPSFSSAMLMGMFLSLQHAKIVTNIEDDLFHPFPFEAKGWNDDMLIDYFFYGMAAS